MRLCFAGAVVAVAVAVSGCTTYEVTVLERATGKPPDDVTVGFGHPGMLMIGKPKSKLASLADDGTTCDSIGSPNADGERIWITVYSADLAAVEAEGQQVSKGEKHTDFLPSAHFEAKTPAKGQRVQAMPSSPDAYDPFFYGLDVWVERK